MAIASASITPGLSLVRGVPLSEEPGLGPLTLPGYLREVCTRYAKNEVLVRRTAEGVERWTYADLWERSVEVAQSLIAWGVTKDSRVGILVTNRPEFLSAVFGTMLAGGVAVILNTFATAPELEQMLQMSGASVLLFERHVAAKDFVSILRELEPALETTRPGELLSDKFPFLRRLAVIPRKGEASALIPAIESWAAFLKGGEATSRDLVDATAATTKPADTAAIFFSSGSTGLPKGMVHCHRAITIQWWRVRRLWETGDDVRCWTANGFFWSGQFVLALGASLSSGGALVLQPIFLPAEALEFLQTERVSMIIARPHQWSQIEALPNYAQADLSKLHYIVMGTGSVKHPTVKSDWPLPPAYGTTETLAINCSLPSSRARGISKDCYGEPLPGNVLKIVDPMTGAIVPQGARGEIAIKGPTLMLNYLGKPRDETVDDDGYYHTADGGYVDAEGKLFFEGRLSDIIKTGGANVSPVEVDTVLIGYPGVKAVQTVGVPHATLDEMVVSCIVPHQGATIDEAALREFLKGRLASYKVPRRVLFFRDDEIAVTAGATKLKSSAFREAAVKRLAAESSNSNG